VPDSNYYTLNVPGESQFERNVTKIILSGSYFVVVAVKFNPRDSHMIQKSPLPLSYIQSHLLFFSGLEMESHSVAQAALEFTM
jgi:hypothetical protein